MARYEFLPPTVDEAPGMDVGGRLFGRVAYPRGISVLVFDGKARRARWPTIEQQEAAEVVYLGGHVHVVDDAAAQVLIDSGFADCLTLLPDE